MEIEVTLKLPENLIEHARQLGAATRRDLGAVLTDALEMLWLTVDEIPELNEFPPIAELPNMVRRNWVRAGWHPPTTE